MIDSPDVRYYCQYTYLLWPHSSSIMKTCAVLCLTASAAALPSQLDERNALVAQIKDRLTMPRCAGPTDATSCAVSRARKLSWLS